MPGTLRFNLICIALGLIVVGAALGSALAAPGRSAAADTSAAGCYPNRLIILEFAKDSSGPPAGGTAPILPGCSASPTPTAVPTPMSTPYNPRPSAPPPYNPMPGPPPPYMPPY